VTGDTIDLRSDLVSPPTPAMIREITAALEEPPAFGLREDARQRALEARVSSLLGKEDALFFPTCTMANQVAIRILCRPGETLVADADAHVITSEAGAPAALSGALVRPLPGRDGRVDRADLERALTAPVDALRSRVALIVLENTHNRAGGVPLPVAYHADVADLAERNGVSIHLDGARLFNATVALGCAPVDIARHVTTVAISLNKALAAPLGAVLAGPRAVIADALRVRQMFGGGVRPIGFLAAAALVALDTMVDRLVDDHRHAAELGHGLSRLSSRGLDVAASTNIVMVRTERAGVSPRELVDALAARGVLALPFGAAIRLVVHHGIGPKEIAAAADAFAAALP